jgi:hypothetical protein
MVEETYVTGRGRTRRRRVRVDLSEVRQRLGLPTRADRDAWQHARELLREAVGVSTFEIWLDRVELIAIDSGGGLVLAAGDETVGWVRDRFGRLISDRGRRAGRDVRIAGELERRAIGAP